MLRELALWYALTKIKYGTPGSYNFFIYTVVIHERYIWADYSSPYTCILINNSLPDAPYEIFYYQKNKLHQVKLDELWRKRK